MTDVLYRYVEVCNDIVLEAYPVTKRTPSGAWIDVYGLKKFVNLKAIKQYASENKDKAWEGLVKRKQRQLKILSSQYHYCKHLNDVLSSIVTTPMEDRIKVPPQEIEFSLFLKGQ